MSTRYTCDVCGFSREEAPLGNLSGEDSQGTSMWFMTLCGDTECLTTALTKMHEPQGIKAFRYFRPFEPRRNESDGQV